MFDVCVIGHITKDLVRIGNVKKQMPGGVAYYFSMALKNLGSNVCLITKAAKKDRGLLDDLIRKDISVFYKAGQETTAFENIYPEGLDFRVQNVKSVAQPFSLEDIPDVSAKIFHVGALSKGDFPLEILKLLSERARISLDVQGFLRKIERGRIKHVDWEQKHEGLQYVNILKTDETEAKILSSQDDVKKAALKLAKYGLEEIIITLGARGSLIYSEGRFYSFRAFPVKHIADPTGCGDTYMAGYIHKRLKSFDIKESGRFAAATASLKLAQLGPFKGTQEDVQNFLEFHQEVPG